MGRRLNVHFLETLLRFERGTDQQLLFALLVGKISKVTIRMGNSGYKLYKYGKIPLFKDMQAELFDPVANYGEGRFTASHGINISEEDLADLEQRDPLLSEGDTLHELHIHSTPEATQEPTQGTFESGIRKRLFRFVGKVGKRKTQARGSNNDRISAYA